LNPKRLVEIEGWALQVLEAVSTGKPFEDSRVDLKKELPDAKKAARRIAGHANAARGDSILWVVGADEKEGLVGWSESEDRADWWSKVSACFDEGIAPALRDVIVPFEGRQFLVLWFETERAPYVVKNPNGGGIDREVPWREGTAVRTAKRSDLLRVLLPVFHRPAVEFLSATLEVVPDPTGGRPNGINAELAVYVTPNSGQSISIPFHRCAVRLLDGDTELCKLEDVRSLIPIIPPMFFRGTTPIEIPSHGCVENTGYQCNLREPAYVELSGSGPTLGAPFVCELVQPTVEFVLGYSGGGAGSCTILVDFNRSDDGLYSVVSSRVD